MPDDPQLDKAKHIFDQVEYANHTPLPPLPDIFSVTPHYGVNIVTLKEDTDVQAVPLTKHMRRMLADIQRMLNEGVTQYHIWRAADGFISVHPIVKPKSIDSVGK